MLKDDNKLQNELCDINNLDNLISEHTCIKKPEGTLIDPIHTWRTIVFIQPGVQDMSIIISLFVLLKCQKTSIDHDHVNATFNINTL